MCSGKGRIKQAICISNIILALCSIIVIAIGVYVLKLENLNLEIFGRNNVYNYAIGVICAGCFLLIISIIGVGSVVLEKACLVKAYIAGHVLLLLLFTFSGGLMLNYKSNIKEAFKNELKSKLKDEYGCSKDVTAGWDALQITNHCCGVYGENPGKIYLSSKWANSKSQCQIGKTENEKVPMSCCARDGNRKIIDSKGCKEAEPLQKDAKHIYNRGCYDQVESKLDYGIIVLAALLIVLAFVCLLGIIFGIMILRITFHNPQFV